MFSRINNYLKLFIASFFYIYLSAFKCYPKRLVIYYHGIRNCEIGRFTRQMEYLSKFCKVVKPSEILDSETDNSKVTVAITFDDAFTSVMEKAVPVLKKYNLPAAIFVPTGNIGQRPLWETPKEISDEDEYIMTADQIRELCNYGFEIGSHTVSHSKLIHLDNSRLKSELYDSKKTLEDIIGQDIISISYPNGMYDQKVCELTEQCGYKIGFIVEPLIVSDKTECLKIGRFGVLPSDSLYEFKLKIRGAYQVVKYLRAFRRFVLRQ